MNSTLIQRRWRLLAQVLALVLLVACSTAPETLLQSAVATQIRVVQPTIIARPSIAPATPSRIPTQPTTAPYPAEPATPYPAPALLPAVDPAPARDLQFSGDRAFAHLQAQMQWIPRHTGTPGWQQNGDYIIAQLQQTGWNVEEQRFPYNGVSVRNIIAKRGSGPVLILGAHYDTRKYADNDPDPANHTQPVPGANDGASGVAVLLELAQHINTDQLGREVWLAFFDAEDNGDIEGWDWTIGASYMAQNLPVKPEAMVLLDMIGDKDLQIYYERTSTAALQQSIWQSAAELGYTQFIPEPKYAMIDDHTPFLQQGIPAVDLIDFDYPPWHTVSDTSDQTSAASLEAVGRTIERWLETRAQP